MASAPLLLGTGICAYGQPPNQPITSGDPGGGFNGSSSSAVIADAFDLQGGGTSVTVQNVTFQASTTDNVTLNPGSGGSVTPYPSGASLSGDANTTAMGDVVGGLVYNAASSADPFTITLLGLTTGQQYLLQLLIADAGGDSRFEDVNLNGIDLGTLTTSGSTAYNVDPTFTALGGGNDVITLNSNSGSFAESSVVTGVVVTPVSPVPEPVSCSLLVMGGIPLLARRRR
jgi:hypothetical protein